MGLILQILVGVVVAYFVITKLIKWGQARQFNIRASAAIQDFKRTSENKVIGMKDRNEIENEDFEFYMSLILKCYERQIALLFNNAYMSDHSIQVLNDQQNDFYEMPDGNSDIDIDIDVAS